jgi:D-alanyl-lipoteichoic acid acyltransferase DltB (MBOAT superfamily)
MTFTEPAFFAFFGAFLFAYYLLRNNLRRQNWLVAGASYFFYGWFDWRFCALLALSTILDYCFGLIIDYAKHDPAGDSNVARPTLILSVACNLLILGYFKYFDFFADSAIRLSEAAGIPFSGTIATILLPAGISFYTFQSLSYIFDVYDKKVRATRSVLEYAVFVGFFPHLVAGPILRAADLLPKIIRPRIMTADLFYSGFMLALYGYFLKIVVADNLSPVVERIYANPNSRGAALLLATYAFAFQIYCDFLGYTTIARGIARMMGFELVLNFNLPYFATNPTEFWRRWHISLSTWLRDYFYIRIGGNRRGAVHTYFALMATMILGGLWHGAAWHFVAWGLFHGALLVTFRLAGAMPWTESTRRLPRPLGIALFFPLVLIGWLLFRATDLNDAMLKLTTIFRSTNLRDMPIAGLTTVATFLVPFAVFETYQFMSGRLEPWLSWPPALRTLWITGLVVAIACLEPPVSTPFIYFQF